MQHSLEWASAVPEVVALFADPAFAPFKARGAPFAVVRPRTGEVLWANAAAAAHFAAADATALAATLLGSGGWLGAAAARVPSGAPARLVRVAPSGEGRIRTAMVSAADRDGDALVGFAVPDAPARDGAAPDLWLRPAWAEVERGETDTGDEPDIEGGAEVDPRPAAPDPGPALARRGQVAVLRDRLGRAADGAAILRILWRADAAGTVAPADLGLLARLGVPLDFAAAPLADLLAPYDAGAAERLSAAMEARRTWSGVTICLPVAGGRAVAPLSLSASPVFGPDRAFAGYRGFGILDLGGLDLAPPGPETASESDSEPPRAAPLPAPPPAAEAAPSDPAPETGGPVAPPADARIEDAAPRPDGRGANVVHLRAFQSPGPGRVASAPDLIRGEDAGALPEGQLGDDLAFRALGEALRARIGAPTRPEPEPEPAAPEDAPDGFAEAEAGVPALPPDGSSALGLLERLPVGVLAVAGGTPVYANPAASALLGFAGPGDLLRAGRSVVASEGDAPALRDAKGEVAPVSARRATAPWEGETAAVYVLETAAVAPAGPPATAAERDGRAGELLDEVDDAVALLDGDGRLRRLNRRGEGWFGPLDPGGPGPLLTQILAPESRARALALLGEVRERAAGPPATRGVSALAGGDEPVPMLLTLGRLGASGFYATLRETPEAGRTGPGSGREAARAAALLAKINHEIRTPLGAILGFAEVMMDERFGPLGNPRYKDYLRDVHAAGEQVVAVVEDLLDLSRIEAGQLDLAVAALDVNRIVSETVAQMATEAHRGRVILRTSLAGRLPAALADERSARQIVRNLLSNAVKFNEPGGQVIVSTALGEGGAVLLRVRDTGVGMTEDEVAAALEPFGDGLAGAPSGGLGLPLSRALAGANGASISIRSRPKEGTLVEVAFAAAGPGEARNAG